MDNLPLLINTEIIIVDHDEIKSAWEWLRTSMSQAPDIAWNDLCIFDQKLWHYHNDEYQALEPDEETSRTLGNLYLASQFGELKSIQKLTEFDETFQVLGRIKRLDPDVKTVLESKPSFRHGLSEHLAFWVQLANAASAARGKFAGSRPNLQPTDKGPDGVFLETGADYKLVVHSVKSSINDPRTLVVSANFRDRGDKADKRKQLDAFWLQVNDDLGITRLLHILEDLCNLLDLTPDQRIRQGLLQDCYFNASVVGDNDYAKAELFEGYRHIPRDPERRIATYIGSKKWETLAENTRQYILRKLKEVGVF